MNAPDEVGQDPGLLAGDQGPDRPAEPAFVERPGGHRIRVNVTAVVLAFRLLAHATSLTAVTGVVCGPRALHARRVRSR